MKDVVISKKQAVHIAGSEEILQRMRVSASNSGEISLLHTGAKLAVYHVGAVLRYFICGYAADGSDVDDILAVVA